MVECNEHRGETEAMASCPRCLILYWESKHAALRTRVEALEAGLEVIAANADMMCCDTATSAMLLRKTLRETRDAARALLEQKP
jgi:hypothetical protein